MNYRLSIVFVSTYLLLLIKSSLVQTSKTKCAKETFSNNTLHVCYSDDQQNRSILVWFTTGQLESELFDSFRFVLRSDENLVLTNFTELVDFNNSLRLYNFNLGRYEICIEFQSNSSRYIYEPRDGCLSVSVGYSLHDSFQQSSTGLLIALASGIALFFILGLVVQWAKTKRQKKQSDTDEIRSRSSSVLSTTSTKLKRHHLVKSLFHHHIEEPRPSHIRQWARNHAFRHRISPDELEVQKPKGFRKWSKQVLTSPERSSQPRSRTGSASQERILSTVSMPTANKIATVSENVHRQLSPRKPSFHLSPPEEYEMV